MYNSKKTQGQAESSQLPIKRQNGAEEVGSKLSDFQIICEIGRGSYGVVNRVLSLVNNNEYVMKKINMKHVKLKNQKEALKEAQILKKIRNSNVIRYFTSFVEDDHLYIIMEYAEGGDLATLIKSYKEKRKTFTEKQIWDFAWELCHAIDYLHNNNIIHRDIKTLNIFLSKDGHIKLGDLGVSKIVSSAASLQGTRVGTPLYLSPELVKQLPYDFKVDIWALGCVLYHLATMEPPFMGDNLITLGYNIVHKAPKPLSNSYSPKLVNLINKFLEKNPSSRPKISEMLDYFPSKYRDPKSPSDLKESNQSSIVNRIEYHNADSAKMLKVDEIHPKKEELVTKPITAWASPDKKSMPSVGMRPTTAGAVRKENLLNNDKIHSNIDSRAILGPTVVPLKVNTSVKPKEINRSPSPTKKQPIYSLAEAASYNGNENQSLLSKRELNHSTQDQKIGQTDKKQQDTESTVENKPRTFQIIMGNAAGNDSTLSAKQVIRENENLKRLSKRQEPNVIIEENGTEKRSSIMTKNALSEENKVVILSARLQTKDLKEPEKDKESNNVKKSSNPDIKSSNIEIDSANKLSTKNKNKQEDQEVVEVVPVNKFDSSPIIPAQRFENRPMTSDAAKKIMMNPLIKSTSPRFKINTRLNQMPTLQANVAKVSNDAVPAMFLKQIDEQKQLRLQEANHSSSDKNKTEPKKDKNDSFEIPNEIMKRPQTQGSGNEIRIRPVSAHILKRMHNNLGQTDDKALKESKVGTNEAKKEGSENQVKAANNPNEQGGNKEVTTKPKTISVERPKSAVFVGRLGPKSNQPDNNFKTIEANRQFAFGGYGLYKPPVFYEGPKKEQPTQKGEKSNVEALKEEDDSDSFDEKYMYGEMFRKSRSNFMRVELLGKSTVTNSTEATKKCNTSANWGMKDPEMMAVRGKQVRPMTSGPIRPMTSGGSKKLTIHDLM